MKKIALYVWSVLAVLNCSPENKTESSWLRLDKSDAVLSDGEAGVTRIMVETNVKNLTVSVSGEATSWLTASVTPRCLELLYGRNESGAERSGIAVVHAGDLSEAFSITQPVWVEPEEPEDPAGPDGPDVPDDPSGEIAPDPEGPGNYQLYDIYYDTKGKAKGIVYWISDDGKTAKVVSLDRTSIAWANDKTILVGASSSTDGAANTALLKNAPEGLEIPALGFCAAHGENWYWPSKKEMEDVFAAYNGTTFSAATNDVPANITDAEKAARAAFDKLLTDNGGTIMNEAADTDRGENYWTSTEYTEAFANSVRFGKPYSSVAADQQGKTTARPVRCIREIQLSGGVDEPEPPVEAAFKPYSEGGTVKGIVYLKAKDGSDSVAISIARAEDVAWCTDGASYNATDKNDGASNTAKIKASAAPGTVPALSLCESLGDGWYWPSINELRKIFDVYNGVPFADKTGLFPNAITDEEKASRAAFDHSLTVLGGKAMNTGGASEQGDRYWSSTEYEYNAAFYGSFFIFGRAYMAAPADTPGKANSSGRYVRCIKNIFNNK